jgi:hypothetical protein
VGGTEGRPEKTGHHFFMVDKLKRCMCYSLHCEYGGKRNHKAYARSEGHQGCNNSEAPQKETMIGTKKDIKNESNRLG